MAEAPSTAYYKNALAKIALHIPGVIKHDAFCAINSYGTIEQVKALFRLDYILQVAHKEGGILKYSFIGAVFVGPGNAAYHAEARRFKGSIPLNVAGVLKHAYLLNDAGLNIYAHSTNFVSIAYNGSPAVGATFHSTFYRGATVGFLMFRAGVVGGVETVTYSEEEVYTLPANTSEYKEFLLDMPAPPSGELFYDVFAFAENDEGRTWSKIRYDFGVRQQDATFTAHTGVRTGGGTVTGTVTLQSPAWNDLEFEYDVVYADANNDAQTAALVINIPQGQTYGDDSIDVDYYDDQMGDENDKVEVIFERKITQVFNGRFFPQI